jgi:hypothetical protein
VVGILVLVALVAAPLTLMALTGTGARRRGDSLTTAVVSGLFFPITWVFWHLQDAPYQTSPSRQSQAIGASRSTSCPPST